MVFAFTAESRSPSTGFPSDNQDALQGVAKGLMMNVLVASHDVAWKGALRLWNLELCVSLLSKAR